MERLAFGVKDTAEVMGISQEMVRRLVRSGKLRRVSDVGDRLLISKKDIQRFLDGERVEPVEDFAGA